MATLVTPYDESGLPQTASLTSYYFGGAYETRSDDSIFKYYSFGGQTIMRDANGLQYFLTDHLGSAVVITNNQGTLTSQQRYLPFGGLRADVDTPNASSTDLGYTGQRSLDSGMGGLMDYKARFYSPYINHFLQPDSLIPDPSNPQAWNRYGYVGNNPVNFNDPTGHKKCSMDNNEKCDEEEDFANYVDDTLERSGGKNDLQAIVNIVNKAAGIYHTYDKMIPKLSLVFLGLEESNAWTIYNAAFNNPPCDAAGRPDCASNTVIFDDEGFHPDFKDGESQPFHFWAYLATAANTEGKYPASYIPGRFMSSLGNFGHEIFIPWFGYDDGASWQDYALARAGMHIGTLVNMGVVPPSQLGNTIKYYVGPNSPGAFYVDPLIYVAPLDGNR